MICLFFTDNREEILLDFPNDDLNQIIVKALTDGFGEGFAKNPHCKISPHYYGRASSEELEIDALARECHGGIRPAPIYPACPESIEQEASFLLVDATDPAGIGLNETYAVNPATSVSSLYFFAPRCSVFWGFQDR